jgi:hypothetical protein
MATNPQMPRNGAAIAFRKPQRVTITVAHSVYHYLCERSAHEGRSLSNLAAHLLERGISRVE